MMIGLAKWLRAAWPNGEHRRAVIDGYASLKSKPLLLADIAARGGVFTVEQGKDLFENGRLAGRREMALEVLRLSKTDPDALWTMIAGLGAKH